MSNAGLAYMARITRGIMKTIHMESADGIPVDTGGRVIVGETAFTVTDLTYEWNLAATITKATLCESGPYAAKHMLFAADGLTLTGAVLKAIRECQRGLPDDSIADHIAGRLSARLQCHIDCARANEKLLEERLRQRDETIKTKDARISELTDQRTRLRSALMSEGKDYAETCLKDARLEAAEKEIGRLQSDLKERCMRIDCLNGEIERLRGELQKKGMEACGHCTRCDGCSYREASKNAEKEIARLSLQSKNDCAKIGALEGELMILRNTPLIREMHGHCREERDRLREEVKGLQSQVSKKSEKIKRADEFIRAKMREIAELNAYIRTSTPRMKDLSDSLNYARMMMQRPTDRHDDVIDALRYAVGDPVMCRCWAPEIDPLNPPDAPWVKEGRTMVIAGQRGGKSEAIERVCRPNHVLCFVDEDKRPYAEICGQCGQVLTEGMAYCHACGASNRPCSSCRHVTDRPDDDGISCDIGGCDANRRWEAKE